jgi:hypothetical protein
LPAAAPTPWKYSRTIEPGDVHGVLRDFKFAAPVEGYFFSLRGLRQMFAKFYFNNPTHVTLLQSSRASCLNMVSLWAHSKVAAAASCMCLSPSCDGANVVHRSLGRLNLLDILRRQNVLVDGHPGPRKKADEHSSTR